MNKCDGNHSQKTLCTDIECWDDTNRHFNIWWHNEGSGMAPPPELEHCGHVELVSRVAWLNGAHKAREDIESLTNSIGSIMAYLITQERTFKGDMLEGNITNELLATWGVRAEVINGHIQILI